MLIAVAFLCFVVGGIAAGITQNRYYQAIATKSDAVTSNALMLDEFLRNPTQMPRANARETKRRLVALATRQEDRQLERMRRQAVAAAAFAIIAFLSILVIPLFKG